MKKFLVFLLGLIFPILSFAVTFDVDGLRYNILSQQDKTVEVAIIPKSLSYPTYSKYSGDYDIPETVTFNNVIYNVIGIGNNAFSECSNIAVTLPKTIKHIGFAAFSYSGLQSIILPEGLESIGAAAFRDCHSLTELTIPNSLKVLESTVFYGCYNLKTVNILSSNISEIPDDTFFKCSALTSVTIPRTVTSFGKTAFYYTSSLTTIDIPEGLTSIGNQCFAASGIESIEIPDGVTELPGAMFSGCTNLKSVILPKHLTTLNKGMFSGCRSLESISLPAELTIIPQNCFGGCWALNYIEFPTSLKYIYEDAFQDCRTLDNVNLPEGLELLGNEAFYNCFINNLTLPSTLQSVGGWCFGIGPDMKTLKLPISLTKIGSYAFSKGNIQEVVCMNPVPVACESNVFKNETYYGTLYVPKGSLDAYKATKPWSDFFNIEEHNFSGIEYINSDSNTSIVSYTNLYGIVSDRPFVGWNIILFSNGKTQKVYIK